MQHIGVNPGEVGGNAGTSYGFVTPRNFHAKKEFLCNMNISADLVLLYLHALPKVSSLRRAAAAHEHQRWIMDL